MRDQRANGASRRDLPIVVAIGLVASAVGIAVGLAIDWFPTPGSTQADDIDTLWDVLVILSVPIFVIVALTVLYSVFRFRKRPGEEGLDGPPIHGNTKLEVVWTTIPAIIIACLVAYAWSVLRDVEAAPAEAATELKVAVTGQQFAWTFEYPGLGPKGTSLKSDQLYVPAGRSVRFFVHSKDVIHDFWVPNWRMKVDAVPGITTGYRITPTRLGTYPVVCAELCGLGHAFMRQSAHVLRPAAFALWVAKRRVAVTQTAAAGTTNATGAIDAKQLFAEGNGTATSCGACHTLASAGTTGTTGPNLEIALKSASKAEIKQDIVDPQAKITKGYAGGIMPPNYGQTLSAAEIDALVDLLYDSSHGG